MQSPLRWLHFFVLTAMTLTRNLKSWCHRRLQVNNWRQEIERMLCVPAVIWSLWPHHSRTVITTLKFHCLPCRVYHSHIQICVDYSTSPHYLQAIHEYNVQLSNKSSIFLLDGAKKRSKWWNSVPLSKILHILLLNGTYIIDHIHLLHIFVRPLHTFRERWGRRIVAREFVKDKMLWKRPITFACRLERRSCSEISKIITEDSTALLVLYTRQDQLDLSSHLCPLIHIS